MRIQVNQIPRTGIAGSHHTHILKFSCYYQISLPINHTYLYSCEQEKSLFAVPNPDVLLLFDKSFIQVQHSKLHLQATKHEFQYGHNGCFQKAVQFSKMAFALKVF